MHKKPVTMTRRTFVASTASTGLVMGLGTLMPGCSQEQAVTAIDQGNSNNIFSPAVWFEVNANGDVKINIAKAEMGQHVGTALARIVADELGAAWDQVSLHHVDTDPKWGYMVTGGSWSVFTSFAMLSRAGAAGRTVLIDAGAALLGVDPGTCRAQDGAVVSGEQRIAFGDIVRRGDVSRSFSDEQLEALPIKPASQRRLIGKPVKARDIPEKSRGAAIYGIDVELPGMVFAHPLIPPTRYGSRIEAVDDSAAKAIPGYQQTLTLVDPSATLQGWAVVIADTFAAAIKASNAVKVTWTPGPTANVDEDALLQAGADAIANPANGTLVVNDGDVDGARAAAAETLSATYRTHTALHYTLEPANALVEFVDGKCHIHSGNQWQSLILPVLSKALGMAETDIVIHQYYLGGGFGRRLYGDPMVPAVLTAKALGKPVKLIFQRDEDSRFDCVRSPSVATLHAAYDSDGALTAVEHAAAAGWPTLSMVPAFLGDGVNGGKFDPFAISGAAHWYTLPAHRVRAVNNELAQKTFLPGYLRAVGPGWIGWGVESFMDEMAHKAGADPVAFRLALLDGAGKNSGKAPESVGGATRLAAALRDVAQRAGWGRDLPPGEGFGVAVAAGQERTMPTWTACVAHVAVKGAKVTVRKIWQTIDCGTVVHPDGALAQAEGATLWGISLALHEGTGFKDGQVMDRNLNTYTPLRMADVPELDLSFMDSTEAPVGLGEPPLIAVAPAIGNAVFAATGQRVRDLPIRLS